MRRHSIVLGLLLLLVWSCKREVGEVDEDERRRPGVVAARQKEEEGRLEEAIRLYREAIDADPKIARAHLDLAFLLHEKARGDEDYLMAVYHYRRYLELRPETDKRGLITTRMQKAKQEFVGAFMGKPVKARAAKSSDEGFRGAAGVDVLERDQLIAELKKKNADLRKQNQQLSMEAKKSRPRTYVVKQGDTLSTIAASYYGDPDRSDAIYKANRQKIRNKNELRPGQILVLP